MLKNLQIEWMKIKNYRVFQVFTVLYLLGIVVVVYVVYKFYMEMMKELMSAATRQNQEASDLFGHFSPDRIWETVCFWTGLLLYLPGMIIIMLFINEVNFKTHRQNIIDGWSRNQFMSAKMVDVFLVSLVVTIIYSVVALIIGFKNEESNNGEIWGKANYIYLVLLQLFSQLSLAFLVAFFVKSVNNPISSGLSFNNDERLL